MQVSVAIQRGNMLCFTVELVDRYDGARMSMTVASQAKQRPPWHGIREKPSWRRSQPGIRPDRFLSTLYRLV